MRHETFDAAERLGEREQRQPFQESRDGSDIALDLEADQRAETALLALGHVVAWMGGQSRIVGFRYLRLAFEEPRDRGCAGLSRSIRGSYSRCS